MRVRAVSDDEELHWRASVFRAWHPSEDRQHADKPWRSVYSNDISPYSFPSTFKEHTHAEILRLTCATLATLNGQPVEQKERP